MHRRHQWNKSDIRDKGKVTKPCDRTQINRKTNYKSWLEKKPELRPSFHNRYKCPCHDL